MEALGKLKKFWVLYIDLMTLQKRATTSVHENGYQLWLNSYEAFIPLFFFDMYNYAPYGGYYAKKYRRISRNLIQKRKKYFQLVV